MTPTQERSQLFCSLTEMEKLPPDGFNKMRIEALRYAAGRFVREELAAVKVMRPAT